MNRSSDPIADLSRLAMRADSDREAERSRVRAISPELTAVMDELKPHARMRAIWVEGKLVAGKEPPPDPPSWCEVSGEMVEALGMFGRK